MCKKKRIYPSNTLYSLVILFARVVLLPLLHAAGFQKQLIIAFLQKGVDSVDKFSLWICHGKAVDTQGDAYTFPTAYPQLHDQGLIHPDHTLGDDGF